LKRYGLEKLRTYYQAALHNHYDSVKNLAVAVRYGNNAASKDFELYIKALERI